MASVKIITAPDKRNRSVKLDASVFEAPIKPYLFHAEVRRQLAARRSGSASTKNRHAVSGGGAKPYKQKGTGRARQGTIRAPQYKGGGAVFGPVPRSYQHKLPKKVRRAALCGALSLRFQEGALHVVDTLEFTAFKTRQMKDLVDSLGLDGSSVLIIIEKEDIYVERSARNLPHVNVLRVGGLNLYDILKHAKLVFTSESLKGTVDRLRVSSEVKS